MTEADTFLITIVVNTDKLQKIIKQLEDLDFDIYKIEIQ